MITLHIMKLLEDSGFGTLMLTGEESGDRKLWWQKLPVGQTGIYVIDNGAPMGRGIRKTQSFDIYARGEDDVEGNKRLKEILDFFEAEGMRHCNLPIVEGYSDDEYKNVAIYPTSNLQNIGSDDTDRVIWVASAQVIYKEIHS